PRATPNEHGCTAPSCRCRRAPSPRSTHAAPTPSASPAPSGGRRASPTIPPPPPSRTKGVALHELAHWALFAQPDLPHHGGTFTRLLLDATTEFLGTERAELLAAAYRCQRVRVGRDPRVGPDGRLRYGWDGRLRLGRGRGPAVPGPPG